MMVEWIAWLPDWLYVCIMVGFTFTTYSFVGVDWQSGCLNDCQVCNEEIIYKVRFLAVLPLQLQPRLPLNIFWQLNWRQHIVPQWNFRQPASHPVNHSTKQPWKGNILFVCVWRFVSQCVCIQKLDHNCRQSGARFIFVFRFYWILINFITVIIIIKTETRDCDRRTDSWPIMMVHNNER